MSGTADVDASAYFRAIEDSFIALRGAPLLLSPEDWQTARAWHEQGVPVELVQRVMEEVFARLRERDPDRRIHSLRYCAPAVDSAWREVRELGATEGRLEPEPVDVAARLALLAERLPGTLPGRERLLERLADLESGGEAEVVERSLEELEASFLAEATAALDEATRAELETRVERALSRSTARIPADERPELHRRMLRELVRQTLELPRLSLFTVGDD